jgi:hypothetical protein
MFFCFWGFNTPASLPFITLDVVRCRFFIILATESEGKNNKPYRPRGFRKILSATVSSLTCLWRNTTWTRGYCRQGRKAGFPNELGLSHGQRPFLLFRLKTRESKEAEFLDEIQTKVLQNSSLLFTVTFKLTQPL